MPPLGRVVLGFLLVVADLRVNGLDLVPDVVGWVLVLAGLTPLTGRSRGFAVAGVAAAAGVLLALPQLLAEPGPVLTTLEGLAETAFVFGTCTGVKAVVADERARRTADRLRWVDLALVAVATVVGLAVGGTVDVDGGGAVLLLVAVLAALAVVAWFLVFLWSLRHRPELAAGLRTGDAPEPGTP